MTAYVTDNAPVDPFLVSDFPTNNCPRYKVKRWQTQRKATQHAALANSFGALPECVTRDEKCDNARSAIPEAGAYSVSPIATHLLLNTQCTGHCVRPLNSHAARTGHARTITHSVLLSLHHYTLFSTTMGGTTRTFGSQPAD